jgi:ankyrin repeat domain-containing protein 50
MYWVQPGNQTIGDQVFDSFAISDRKTPLQTYITSWKRTQNDDSGLTGVWTAVLATVIGFAGQFLGLRACHSSVAVMQLAVTLAMTVIRASLRTQRLKREENLLNESPGLVEGHELDFLALTMVELQRETPTIPEETLRLQRSRHPWRLLETPRGVLNTPPVIPSDSSNSSIDGFTLRTFKTADLVGHSLKAAEDIWTARRRRNANNLLEKKMFFQASCKPWNLEADAPPSSNQDLAEYALWYRSGLARITEASAQQTEPSSQWDPAHAVSRDIARMVAGSIDKTMEILFSSEPPSPVSLHEGWGNALTTVVRLPFSFSPEPSHSPGLHSAKLSLRREFDYNGDPRGFLKCDKAEIEALLGLWVWSLKDMEHPLDETEGDIERDAVSFGRMLFVKNEFFTFPMPLDLQKWGMSTNRVYFPRLQSRLIFDLEASKLTTVQNQVWWRDGRCFRYGPR